MERALAQAAVAAADPYDFWRDLPGEWVEPPNQRRGGFSGVQRVRGPDGLPVYRKQQIGHAHRDWRHPLGEPTVLREARALRAFAALGIGVPTLLFCGRRDTPAGEQALLVTEALAGFESLQALQERGALQQFSPLRRAALFHGLGALLARLHRARWQHGCLYPKHIFLRSTGDAQPPELALLDLEKSRRRLTRRQAARHDLRQLRRHTGWTDADWAYLEAGYRSTRGEVFEG